MALAPLLSACADGPDSNTLPDTPAPTASVSFLDKATLELLPSEKREVTVVTSPGVEVAFLLLGDVLDASLDRSVVKADSNGRASITLKAPSQPAAFVLRAQVGPNASAELHVAVSELGFTTLRVVPVYQGKRALGSTWSADVLVGQPCSAALSSYPEDPVGALNAQAEIDESPEIESVPVGPQLAVAIRSGAMVAGCRTFTASTPESVEVVEVTVLDRPMVLDQAALLISLDLAPTGAGYDLLIGDSVAALAEAAFPADYPFATLLLDTMELEVPGASLGAFQTARAQAQIDDALSVALAGFEAHQFCVDQSASAITFAAADASSGATKIEGLISAEEGYAMPSFTLESFGGIPAAEVGAPRSVTFSWSATADDHLLISGVLPVSSTRFAGAFMNRAVSELAGEPTTVSAGIALAADCASIATLIDGTGVSGCDASCLELACEAAISSRWELGLAVGDSADGSFGRVEIAVGGEAEVSPELVPTSFTGSWLGKLFAFEQSSDVGGQASGDEPPPP